MSVPENLKNGERDAANIDLATVNIDSMSIGSQENDGNFGKVVSFFVTDEAATESPGPSGLGSQFARGSDYVDEDNPPSGSSINVDSLDVARDQVRLESSFLEDALDPSPGPSGISRNSEELGIDSMKIVMLLAMNEAYAESLDKLIRNVQYAIVENKKRQEAINALMGKTSSAADFFGNKKRVPVNQFHPPYFRDRFGMIPPANVETQRKLLSGDYDPLIKAERKWLPKDLEKLRCAVKREIAEERCASQKRRRTELQENLKKSGQETHEEERTAWMEEIESLNRVIDYTRNLSDDEVFGSEYDYAKIEWSKIATYDFLDTRSATQLRLKWSNEQSPKWSKAKWTTDEVTKLRDLTTGPWVRWEVVARRLGTARTPFQCFKKYKLDLDKELKTSWTKEEDTALITLCHSMRTNGKIPWEKVYHYMEGRSRQQCKVRYARTLDAELKHGRWSEEEDILLKCAIGRFGKNWKQVASCVPGRTDAQCRDRWVNILDEKIKDSPWTLEEDEKLLRGVREIGKEWARIAVMLPGRTGDHCKSRFRSLMVSKVKLCSQSHDEMPLRLVRRHDTTKHRRERREAVEKHFKELLAADGQDEVAQELTEHFRTESLSVDDMAALADVPPEQRKVILQLMQESELHCTREGDVSDGAATSKTLYNLLHEKLSVKPEFLDNATRTILFRAYERACLNKLTGRRPREILSGEEKYAFLESLDCLPTEEDKRKFLMDHLVNLMGKSDNVDRCFLHQQVTRSQCVIDLKYHLKEELVKEVERSMKTNTSNRQQGAIKLNPLPPFAGSIKMLASFKNMLPTLKNRALWSFNRLKEACDEVHLQLSEEIKQSLQYIALKMKLRSLLFLPALLDRAIESDSSVKKRDKLRSTRAEEEKEFAAIEFSDNTGLSKPGFHVLGPELTVRDLIDARRRNRLRVSLPGNIILSKKKAKVGRIFGNSGDIDNTEPSFLKDLQGDDSLIAHLRPEAERLSMIDECIAAVCKRVVNESIDSLLNHLKDSPEKRMSESVDNSCEASTAAVECNTERSKTEKRKHLKLSGLEEESVERSSESDEEFGKEKMKEQVDPNKIEETPTVKNRPKKKRRV